ncbi:Hypothetical protein CINCED_3A017476 [Cinara cedri]|uniref:Uncharacterized protein n=1 Tax=Cinara cedri TaxID=506608 RepID=A0A5E4NAZ2_9HEMI|nr:Hypothetical protein CINCED_3A017476 [Cinara cedri]
MRNLEKNLILKPITLIIQFNIILLLIIQDELINIRADVVKYIEDVESVKNSYKAIIQALEEEIENEDNRGVMKKNAFFPVFDAILINLEKDFLLKASKWLRLLINFFQLNFEEILYFVHHYKDFMNVSKDVLQSEIVAKNCILQSTDENYITLNDVKKVLTKQTFKFFHS